MPPPQRVPAHYFDGETAARAAVLVSLDLAAGLLRIADPDGAELAAWPVAGLRVQRDAAGHAAVFYRDAGDAPARVAFDSGAGQGFAAWLPRLRDRPRTPDQWRRALLWSGGALAAVALIYAVLIPAMAGQLARAIPAERAAAIGEAALAQVAWLLGDGDEDLACSSPAGDAALARMAARLTDAADPLPYSPRLRVFDHHMINAFAAPGGHVVILRGLLETAASPEEVAGILAHEFGHVAHRDALTGTLRTVGTAGILSLLLGDVTGGAAMVLVAETLVNASYTRRAEARADAYAIATLQAAGLPPAALAGFFERMQAEHGDLPGVLQLISTHPGLAERAAAARSAGQAGDGFTPVLTAAEWAALRAICD
jgi:beta-barrel assembly-enhancing protease